MRLYYYDRELNFGDELNSWLWERLLPGRWDPDDEIGFAGIGTILTSAMPAAKRWIIFTSGVGYGTPPHRVDERQQVIAVRGPLSADVLGLSRNKAITDGAALLGTLPEFATRPGGKHGGVVFVPHHKGDAVVDWNRICEAAGVEYLSPRQASRAVIPRIAGARLVLAEAMHAAIFADALRVPWIPIVTSPQVSTFKWLDWTQSMSVPYRPVNVPAVSTAHWLRQACFRLTGDHNVFVPSDDALAQLHRQSRNRQRLGWPIIQRFGKKIRGRAYALASKGPVSKLLTGRDELLFARAVASLDGAARNDGFLSDGNLLAERQEQLASRLRMIDRLTTFQ